MRAVWLEAGIAVICVQLLAAAAVFSAERNEGRLRVWLHRVVSAAVGVLLGTAGGHLLPEAIEALGRGAKVWLLLAGTVAALFCFERVLHRVAGVSAEPAPDLAGQECEDIHAHAHGHGVARPSTLLLGSFTHSLVDGASIAAAFAVGPRLGWIAALAVGLHEVPHRVGDFALLLHMELERRRAALLAVGAGLSGLLGWLAVAAVGQGAPGRLAWLLPISAGSFFYIALFDLLPEVVRGQSRRGLLFNLLSLAAGAVLAIGLTRLPGA